MQTIQDINAFAFEDEILSFWDLQVELQSSWILIAQNHSIMTSSTSLFRLLWLLFSPDWLLASNVLSDIADHWNAC